MAQVVGGTTYDFMLDRKIKVAHDRIKDAADLWAKNGRSSFEVDILISIILRIFSERWTSLTSEPQLIKETRPLKEWANIVKNSYEELRKMKGSCSEAIYRETQNALIEETKLAANEWSIGNPEEPPTWHMLNIMIHILFDKKFIFRPSDPKTPKSFVNLRPT